ncbi:MAG: hypothetical protein PVG65_05575 [Candidatus Thorarchaeota archaeon]|jgi:hypothetical protein
MIRVVDLEKKPECLKEFGMNKEDFINSSSIAGGDPLTIVLGFYDDIEKKRISFFHELGHILILDETLFEKRFKSEKQAWDAAYELADSLGIEFSKKCKGWAKKCLSTYREKNNEKIINSNRR